MTTFRIGEKHLWQLPARHRLQSFADRTVTQAEMIRERRERISDLEYMDRLTELHEAVVDCGTDDLPECNRDDGKGVPVSDEVMGASSYV